MKQGNQFYLELQISDENDNLINIDSVDNIVFQLDELTKTYTQDSEEVTYNTESQSFRIWLTQEETFTMKSIVKIEARVKFLNNTIGGTYILDEYIYDSLNEDVI